MAFSLHAINYKRGMYESNKKSVITTFDRIVFNCAQKSSKKVNWTKTLFKIVLD